MAIIAFEICIEFGLFIDLGAELFVQKWNVIIPFGLEEVSSDWIAQIVFFGEIVDFESATIFAAGIW